jgi:hypothetical protein
MLSITKQEVTPEILNLFDLNNPTMPRAFNVLEGIITGQILVDNLTHPDWAVVREGIYGTLYFGGQITSSVIPSIFRHFFQFGGIGVGRWLDDPLNKILPANPDYDGFTLYFTERSFDEINLEALVSQLPSSYALLSREEQLFKKSFDYDSTLACPTKRAPDVWDSAAFSSIFLASSFFCSQAESTPAHTQVTQTVSPCFRLAFRSLCA